MNDKHKKQVAYGNKRKCFQKNFSKLEKITKKQNVNRRILYENMRHVYVLILCDGVFKSVNPNVFFPIHKFLFINDYVKGKAKMKDSIVYRIETIKCNET
jgi:hypothetical protein